MPAIRRANGVRMVKALYLAQNYGELGGPMANARSVMHHSGHNLGNFAFWNATRLLLKANTTCIPFGKLKVEDPEDYDLLVVPAANFLNPTSDLGWLADIIEDLRIPVLVFGLGAQSEHDNAPVQLTDGTVRFLQVAAQNTPYLAVRGEYTRSVCAAYGVENVQVMGCPSIFTNPDRGLGKKIEAAADRRVSRVAVHASSIKAHVRDAERYVFGLLQAFPGSSYIVQRPAELIKIILDEATEEKDQAYLARVHEFLAPDMTFEEFIGVLKSSGFLPYSIPSWCFHLRSYSHSLGTRIHGALMSMSAALPTVCITHDTRTRELCETLKVPNIAPGALTRFSSVRDLFMAKKLNGAEFEANRTALAKQYVDLIETAGFTPTKYIRDDFR